MSPIHASVIISFAEFSEISEFSESLVPFRQNSIGHPHPSDGCWSVTSDTSSVLLPDALRQLVTSCFVIVTASDVFNDNVEEYVLCSFW